MKRSRAVKLTTALITGATATTLSGCDQPQPIQYDYVENNRSVFDYKAERRLRITCDKPEDFSQEDCHKPGTAQQTSRAIVHTYNFRYAPSYSYPSGSFSPSLSYGPRTATAQSVSSARRLLSRFNLQNIYRAFAVKSSTFQSMGMRMTRSGVPAISLSRPVVFARTPVMTGGLGKTGAVIAGKAGGSTGGG